ncbi:hypothetical protein M885DRAFT_539661 [Pelagophyceae sp. CCMP2097]|nr:hypothetical protein M885DRAFT_539661 [Pelagophyceae sp. CCMP2097]
MDGADEMASSREALLRKIQRSSEDIAGRCREAMEQTKENVAASLFDDDERARVVEAYAAKLKASREDMVLKIEEHQAEERRKLIDELKRDVSRVIEGVLENLKDELDRENRGVMEESDQRRQEHVKRVLHEHADETRRFNEEQVRSLRDSMAAQRDDALRKYHDEMASFREEQLAELARLNFDDLASLDGESASLAAPAFLEPQRSPVRR